MMIRRWIIEEDRKGQRLKDNEDIDFSQNDSTVDQPTDEEQS